MTKPFNQEEITKALEEHEEFRDINEAITHCEKIVGLLTKRFARTSNLHDFDRRNTIIKFASELNDVQDRIIADVVRSQLGFPKRIDEQ